MKVSLREITGPWDQGWALDKHMLKSTFLGHDGYGHPQFDNVRTEVGEATYQLKYRGKLEQAPLLAKALASKICPKFSGVDFIVPMPATKKRAVQPVNEVARALGKILQVPVFEDLLRKNSNGKSLKDLSTKDEKLEALHGTISVNDEITNDGKWNVLLIDDLYDSGASMEAASQALRTYKKVRKIYVAALTWK